MILKLKYTQAELKKLEELYKKYYSLPSHVSEKQEVIDTWEAIRAITDKVEGKALDYYKTHLKELETDILDEFKIFMSIAANNNPAYEFVDGWLNWVKKASGLSTFLKLLDAPTIEKIDEIYENRRTIIGSPEVMKLIKTAEESRKALQKPPQILNTHYALMRQGIAVNTLTKIKSSKKNMRVNEITGKATIQRGDFSVSFENWPEITGLRTSTHKLFNALMIEFTETGGKDTRITLPLKKYMELRGLNNELSARRQVDEDLATLFSTSISFKEKLKEKKSRDYFDMRLVIDKGIKKGVIYCTFHPDFYELMMGYRVMPMAKKALALDDRYNKSSYYFLTKLSEHMNMNYFKPNRDIISVQTLLDATPEIPTYNEVAKNGRHYARYIIDPFERDMDALEKIGAIKWEYCHSNGLALTDDELHDMSYEIFSKLLIKFKLIDYPERELKQLSKPKNRQKKRKK